MMMMIIIISYNDVIQIYKMSMAVIMEEDAQWIEKSDNCHIKIICIQVSIPGFSPMHLGPIQFHYDLHISTLVITWCAAL